MKILKTLIAVSLVCLMAMPSWAALTVDNLVRVSMGSKKMAIYDIDFDSSYAIGGEAFDYAAKGFLRADSVKFISKSGLEFEYDYTNKKVKAFMPGKSLVVEESVTVASNLGQLAHKPFYILSVESTTGTTTGPFSVIPTGETPLTTQCAVTFTSGVLTFLTGDAVTAARVTYIPLHETGPFSSANLVVDEAVTAAAAKAALANRASAVQYVWDDTDGVIDGLEPVGEAPSATHKAVVDITNATPATDIDFHADDEGNSIKVTYIKYGTFPPYRNAGDGDITLASEIYNFTTNHYNHIAIPGLGTALVGEATATNVELIWSGPSASVGAGVPTLDFELNQWSTNESTAITTTAVPLIFLDPNQEPNGMLEIPNAYDLSGVTDVKVEIIGY